MIGRLDERVARQRRRELGERLWLLSWQRDPDGRWRARLSCPELPRTVERTGWTRCAAITRSTTVVRRTISLRCTFQDELTRSHGDP